MVLASWVLFLILGKIIIYVFMKFELPKPLKRFVWFTKLHDCSLCSGVWVYIILSLFMGVDLLSTLVFTYVPIVSEVVTGVVVSWVVWIFTLGWHSAYDIVVV